MLACQFHQSSARAARVRFPADAAFLMERESQAFKQSGIHLWMAVNKGGKDNVFSMGGGRGRGGGEQTNRVISLHLSRKGGLKKNFSPAGNRTPVFRGTGGDTHHYTTEEVNMEGRQRGLIATPCNCSLRKKKLFPCGESNPGRGGESAES